MSPRTQPRCWHRRGLSYLLLVLATTATLPRPLAAQVAQAEFAARRAALAEALDGPILVLGAGAPEHDYLPFAQRPDLRYLTGVLEPEAALLLTEDATLFVLPRDPALETWEGKRLGTVGASSLTGLAAREVSELEAVLDSVLAGAATLHVIGDVSLGAVPAVSLDQQLVDRIRQRHPDVELRHGGDAMQRLRATKSAAEHAAIRTAVDITVLAQREAMGLIEPGMSEFEVQALIEYTFRRNGAERPGFATIVGSGPNATTLHYNANDRVMRAGDMVVMDIGALWDGYSADVTRTVPVSGTFTPEQRAIYQIVRDAQAAAEAEVQPGAPATAMINAAAQALADGLARLGLIDAPDAVYDCGEGQTCPQLGLFYMHGLGHGIGLEVHDPDTWYFPPNTIQPGSAFTIEPGLYVREYLLDILPDTPGNRALAGRIGPAVRRYANVGVRIEDDYLVTAEGAEWISRAPREIDEIEALMAEPWRGPAPRNPALIERYPGGNGTPRR